MLSAEKGKYDLKITEREVCILRNAGLFFHFMEKGAIDSDAHVFLADNILVESPSTIYFEIPPLGKFKMGAYSSYAGIGIFNISIGRYSKIGHNTGLHTEIEDIKTNLVTTSNWVNSTHTVEYESLHPFYDHKIIEIGNNVTIGDNVLLRPGIIIGDGAIVRSFSTVKSNVSPFSIVEGTNGEVVGKRYTDNIIDDLLAVKWWQYDLQTISINPSHDIVKLIEYFSEKNSSPDRENWHPTRYDFEKIIRLIS